MSEWKLRIKQARERKGLNKTEFARLVGVSNPTVTDWEKSADDGGIKELSGPKLAKISEVLGVDPHWLISGRNPPSGEPSSSEQGPKEGAASTALRVVEQSSATMLQRVNFMEAELLTKFRECDLEQQQSLLAIATGFAATSSEAERRDQA